jgi:hypothetical protein
MSNLGFRPVYKLFNAEDDIVCEACLPATENGTRRATGVGGSTGHDRIADAVSEFDVFAFSVSFRMGLHEHRYIAQARANETARR